MVYKFVIYHNIISFVTASLNIVKLISQTKKYSWVRLADDDFCIIYLENRLNLKKTIAVFHIKSFRQNFFQTVYSVYFEVNVYLKQNIKYQKVFF